MTGRVITAATGSVSAVEAVITGHALGLPRSSRVVPGYAGPVAQSTRTEHVLPESPQGRDADA